MFVLSQFGKRLIFQVRISVCSMFIWEWKAKKGALILALACPCTEYEFWNGEWNKASARGELTLLPISDPCSLLTQAIVPISALLIPHVEHGKFGKCRQRPYCDELTHRLRVEDKRGKNNGTMNPHFLKTQKGPAETEVLGEKDIQIFKMGHCI